MKNQKILTILLIVLMLILIFQIKNMNENFSFRINDLNNNIGELESTVKQISNNLEDDSIILEKNIIDGDIEEGIQNVKIEVKLEKFTEITEVYFTTESEEIKMEKIASGKYALDYKYPIYEMIDFDFLIVNHGEKRLENGGELSNDYLYNFINDPMMDMTYSDSKIEIKNLEFYFPIEEDGNQKIETFEIYVESGDKKFPLYKGDEKFIEEINNENIVSTFVPEIKEKFDEKLEKPSYLIFEITDNFGLKYEKRYLLYPEENKRPEANVINRVYDKEGKLVLEL